MAAALESLIYERELRVMKNVTPFPDEVITKEDVFYVCSLIERIARRLETAELVCRELYGETGADREIIPGECYAQRKPAGCR